ncbi:MAG: ATP-binding protein [Rhodospirillaceae bacterium]|nr:ATP-binding protein [Rhodospirillaceae bacterium]
MDKTSETNDFAMLLDTLGRIASALERQTPKIIPIDIPDESDAFIWQTEPDALIPVPRVNRLPIALLKGIEGQKSKLLDNTLRFAKGLPANNALLWGARGTGKSSLVKAVHAEVNATSGANIAMLEIQREDIPSLARLMRHLKNSDRRFLLFCDDLSFENQDESYKSLKSILDGGLEGRPDSVLFYATSNRRHLMSRQMIENERVGAIHQGEAVEEKVSLSDRFGMWIGFHNMDQDTYLDIIRGYCSAAGLPLPFETIQAKALEWSMTRGGRSGRVAWQFFTDLCGSLGVPPKL